jgi:hypothetical protein
MMSEARTIHDDHFPAVNKLVALVEKLASASHQVLPAQAPAPSRQRVVSRAV